MADTDLITKGQVKAKLRRIFHKSSTYATYDDGCIGVDFDWEKIDGAIDKIPSPKPKLDDRQSW